MVHGVGHVKATSSLPRPQLRFLIAAVAATDKLEEKMFNFAGGDIRLFFSPGMPTCGSGDYHTYTACVW